VSGPVPVGVRAVLFPKKGFSATELLLAVNVTVAALLFALLGSRYAYALREWAGERWIDVHTHGAYGWFLPTLFLHAGPGHLTSNLLALIGAAGAVEFLMGGGWTVAVYFLTGIGAAWISYAGHGGPPLSIRRRRLFTYAQRWKVWRVYVPLFLLVFLPTLVHADVHAHTGGFLCGFLLGFFVPPHRRVALLAVEDSLRDEETAEPPAEPET
jgi:membrane associated rhomboid family serine protease